MSVPLPAMLVATVTDPILPACATIPASFSCCFAFSTSCLIPDLFNMLLINSDLDMSVVPINIGCPSLFLSSTSFMIALYLIFLSV